MVRPSESSGVRQLPSSTLPASGTPRYALTSTGSVTLTADGMSLSGCVTAMPGCGETIETGGFVTDLLLAANGEITVTSALLGFFCGCYYATSGAPGLTGECGPKGECASAPSRGVTYPPRPVATLILLCEDRCSSAGGTKSILLCLARLTLPLMNGFGTITLRLNCLKPAGGSCSSSIFPLNVPIVGAATLDRRWISMPAESSVEAFTYFKF